MTREEKMEDQMKTYDLNVGMVGLRVSCLILGMSVFGTIKEVTEVTSKQLDKSVVILKGLIRTSKKK